MLQERIYFPVILKGLNIVQLNYHLCTVSCLRTVSMDSDSGE